MTEDDRRKIMGLRLLIARAAASDSLRWWDDESLTDAGLTLARRLFARQPAVAARRLALRAALVRHKAALGQLEGVIHLFDLGDEIELTLEEGSVSSDFDEPSAIGSPDEFRQQLASLGIDNEPTVQRKIGAAIELRGSAEDSPLQQASILAAGYGLGALEQPVFPYLRRHRAPS